MYLETERLILRPWSVDDAADLFEFARNPKIGPIAGWNPHKSVEESEEIIRSVLSAEGTFAVVLKSSGKAVGSIGLMRGKQSNLDIPDDEAEIGYWIGEPFWGKGLIPEAVRELIRYGFEDLKLNRLWCGYYDGNEKSKRVQEKCGFKYHHTKENVFCELINEIHTEHITVLERGNYNG
ncbi:MAG: GNAT family N-acetyltransferase [Ruminococcaceae bacterium]|nr:GNAT family N-acetyltransferase [Oscillospiraceae bacterium]